MTAGELWLSNWNGCCVICRSTGLRAALLWACLILLLVFCLNSCNEWEMFFDGTLKDHSKKPSKGCTQPFCAGLWTKREESMCDGYWSSMVCTMAQR